MTFAVLQFPASNCDQDAIHALRDVLGHCARLVWHKEQSLGDADVVVVPGGFSYGDYLRCGAIARFSPVMSAVQAHADAGGPVLGICNGFQILCEAGLLPGALIRNRDLHFVCDYVNVRVENTDTPFTHELKAGSVLQMPIAHAEGNFVCDDETFDGLQREGRIIFRYCDRNGELTDAANPNGSRDNIAGICNRERNVLGLMPHPERACEDLLGSSDGREVFRSLAGTLAAAA